MKKCFTILLIALSSVLPAREDISQLGEETDELYREGAGNDDGAYTALATSMIGWGVGTVIVIGILAGALSSSK